LIMSLSNKILICRAPYNWYQVIKSHFISSGSTYTNCWYTKNELQSECEEEEPEAGTLVLFMVEKDNRQMIVGGGYYQMHLDLDVNTCWKRYGVRTGCLNYEAFKKRVIETNNNNLKDKLSCYIISGSFIFVSTQMIAIPEEFRLTNDKNANPVRFFVSTEEPLGLYLQKVTDDYRVAMIDIYSQNHDWPGIYYRATISRSFEKTAQYKTILLSTYNRRCAVTGCHMTPVLEVAHIKTMYDDRYVSVGNGIILRADIHSLFSQGLMTFCYKGIDKIVVKLSNQMLEEEAPYSEYDGKELLLPDDRRNWPNKEYLEWHNKVRFENWLKYGEFSFIESVPMHPKDSTNG